jgi:hypothetical protein
MAIDTAEKRKSSLCFGGPWLLPGVTPNAAKDAEWRRQGLWAYSGIAAAIPAVVAGYVVHLCNRALGATLNARAMTTKFLNRSLTVEKTAP